MRIEKLYEEGNKRIDKMLDLKKLVRNIRTMKTVLKHSFMTPTIKKSILNIDNHVIDLSDPEDSEKEIPVEEQSS